MPSFWNRRIKTKKFGLIIEKSAYFLFYLFSIALFYLIWDSYIKKDTNIFILYIIIYSIFGILFYFVINDLYNNYKFFEKVNNSEGIALLENTHFLCADPMCPRCGGWYVGLFGTLSVTVGLNNAIIPTLRIYNISPYYSIMGGMVLFLLATPIHGALNFLTKGNLSKKIGSNSKLKFVLGLISGFSLAFIVLGILMLISVPV